MPCDTPEPRLILGSASPRRAQLMHQLQLPFEQVVSPDAEPEPADDTPREFVIRSAAAKARAVRRMIPHADAVLIIGADTVVVVDEQICGKPRDQADATRMLERLSARTHSVLTGICLLSGSGEEWHAAECTQVTMGCLSAADIAWYVASGEPLDKAGAYGIQGLGARFIERIEGCYYNVVGLPLARLSAMLTRAGFSLTRLVPKPLPPHE